MYTPAKYFRGLSKTKKAQRLREIQRFGKKNSSDPTAYVGFSTDIGVKTRESKYTRRFRNLFPDARSLKERSDATGVPLWALQKSYDRGLAAWRTGHRPGATQQQWGYARVDSLLTGGKTYWTTDADLVREAKKRSRKARAWWKSTRRQSDYQTRM